MLSFHLHLAPIFVRLLRLPGALSSLYLGCSFRLAELCDFRVAGPNFLQNQEQILCQSLEE